MPSPDFCFTVPQSLFVVIQQLQRAGHRVVIVGGALRDFLRGAAVGDYDLASDALPQQVQKLFRRCRLTGLRHGTLTVLQGAASYEITTFRSDGIYKDARHPQSVSFTRDLAGDLARRDFRINALAFEPGNTSILECKEETISLAGWLHDFHGGLSDLAQGRISAIGQPLKRFEEDALRPLRACRFSAKLGFEIEAATLEAIRQQRQNLKRISRPRVQEELRKLLCAPFALRGLRYLQESKLWPEVFPHLPEGNLERFEALWQLRQSSDNWPAMLLQMAQKRGIRLGGQVSEFSFVWGLLHLALLAPDFLGQTKERLESFLRDWHSPASDALYHAAKRGLDELGFSNREKNGVLALLAHRQLIWGPDFLYLIANGDSAYIRVFLAILGKGPALSALSLLALSSQASGAPTELWRPFCARLLEVLAQRPVLSVGDLAIDGKMLRHSGINPGPAMGRLLRQLLAHVLLQPQDNNSHILLQLAQQYPKGQSLE